MNLAGLCLSMAAICSLLLANACSHDPVHSEASATRPSLREISAEQWQFLSQQKIYFGHQSVGANLLDGVKQLIAEDPRIRLHMVESAHPEAVEGPALVESRIGVNGNPQSKADEFAAILGRGFGQQGGIAMYKYCYLDVLPTTDPERMFQQYREGIQALQAKYPGLTIVHITLPLTTVESGWKFYVKKLLGRPTDRELDAKRQLYNRLLRKQYGGVAPLFDLARVESTHADGTRESFTLDGETVYSLAPEYTSDGGHLNAAGRRAAAQELLRVLAGLGKARSEPAAR